MTTTRRSFFKRGLAALAACVGAKAIGNAEPPKPSAPYDFWDDPREDIYTRQDGQPVIHTFSAGDLDLWRDLANWNRGIVVMKLDETAMTARGWTITTH
jgi:hypothetical protein